MSQQQNIAATDFIEWHEKRSINVGVGLTDESQGQIEEDLVELQALLTTLRVQTVGKVVQRRKKYSARSLLGEGKIEEIKNLVAESNANLVVFDHALSPPQLRNIEETLGCQVTDRTGIILEIFHQHARTSEAKTQVEIARLEYLLPRMVGAWTHFQRQSGGGLNRGMGEKQVEVDRRRAREKIIKLKRQLNEIKRDRQTQRKSRTKELSVALVGYTNSGKSTLMNRLTDAEVVVADKLFASLDAKVKTLDPRTKPRVLLTDTVGFIRNLPHGLVQSFRSTLEEVLSADLLLHVVDISRDNYRAQIETTEDVLKSIEADHIPVMMIFNKIDKVEEGFLGKVLRQAYPDSLTISALDDKSVPKVKEAINKFFEANLVTVKLAIPHTQQDIISKIYRTCMVLNTDFETAQNYGIYEVQATKTIVAQLKGYILNGEMPA